MPASRAAAKRPLHGRAGRGLQDTPGAWHDEGLSYARRSACRMRNIVVAWRPAGQNPFPERPIPGDGGVHGARPRQTSRSTGRCARGCHRDDRRDGRARRPLARIREDLHRSKMNRCRVPDLSRGEALARAFLRIQSRGATEAGGEGFVPPRRAFLHAFMPWRRSSRRAFFSALLSFRNFCCRASRFCRRSWR